MLRSILCTKPDGGVGVIKPTPWAYARTHGGVFIVVDGKPRPWAEFFSPQREIDKMVANGRRPVFARRWIMSAVNGGMTDAEFYEAIIEKDMAKGWTAPELIDEPPSNRWFRDAWRRSHNGGPIYLDLERAKIQQARRLRSAHADRLGRDPFFEFDLGPWLTRIKCALSVDDLRAVWPVELAGANGGKGKP
jgi:hypothetical protein